MDVTGTERGAFVTPSGNFECEMLGIGYFDPDAQHQVRCDIYRWRYKTPKRPTWCPTDCGHSFGLDTTAGVGFNGDAIGQDTEPYGERDPSMPSFTSWSKPGVDQLTHIPGYPGDSKTGAVLGYDSSMTEGDRTCGRNFRVDMHEHRNRARVLRQPGRLRVF